MLTNAISERWTIAELLPSIDLKDAFWQIALDADSKEKTAFTVLGRRLPQFEDMPFALCNALQTMRRLIKKMIAPILKTQAFAYLADLLVSDNFVGSLHLVANQLRAAELTINVEKSKFCLYQVRYLDHSVRAAVNKREADWT